MRTLHTISLGDAREILDGILTEAVSDGGKPITVCVVDVTGKQLLAAAMNDVKAASVPTAHAKAITAIEFQHDTVEFHHAKDSYGNRLTEAQFNGLRDRALNEDPYSGWNVTDVQNGSKINSTFATWAGGVLIRSPHDGSIIGAVGVSGREELEDHELASLRPSGWSA